MAGPKHKNDNSSGLTWPYVVSPPLEYGSGNGPAETIIERVDNRHVSSCRWAPTKCWTGAYEQYQCEGWCLFIPSALFGLNLSFEFMVPPGTILWINAVFGGTRTHCPKSFNNKGLRKGRVRDVNGGGSAHLVKWMGISVRNYHSCKYPSNG